MSESTLDPSVVDWIIEHPESMALLEELGIDGTCAENRWLIRARPSWRAILHEVNRLPATDGG